MSKFANSFNPGCDCCAGGGPCNGSLPVSLTYPCEGESGPATVTLTFGSTTDTLDSGTYVFTSTTSSGWSSGTAGVVTVTQSGYVTTTVDVTLGCSNQGIGIEMTPDCINVRYIGCNFDYVKASITITQGSNTFGPETTNTDGSYKCIPITEPDNGSGYTITATSYGFESQTVYYSSFPCNITLSGTVDDDHICCDCPAPSCKTLSLTTALGPCTLTYDPTTGTFDGQITASVTGYPVTTVGDCNYFCEGDTTTVECTFYYTFSCSDGGYPALSVEYMGCAGAGDPSSTNPYIAAADVVTGFGGGYEYQFDDTIYACGGTIYTGHSFGHIVTCGGLLDPDCFVLDTCSGSDFGLYSGLWHAHGSFADTADQYDGSWTITEACSGGHGPINPVTTIVGFSVPTDATTLFERLPQELPSKGTVQVVPGRPVKVQTGIPMTRKEAVARGLMDALYPPHLKDERPLNPPRKGCGGCGRK